MPSPGGPFPVNNSQIRTPLTLNQDTGLGIRTVPTFAKRTYCEHGTKVVQDSYTPSNPETCHRPFVPLANPRHKEHVLCPPLPCVSLKDPPRIGPRPCPPRSPRSSASSTRARRRGW